MTLIVGLKADDSIVIGAEQEETGGYTSKRAVTKLKLITGRDWAVVIGGAGDAILADKATAQMENKLAAVASLDEETILSVTDRVLDSIYTKYVDKDKDSEGISLVIGATFDQQLLLISTAKRVPQPQNVMAYAGYGADIGIYFIDRLHRPEENWRYAAKVAGFTLQQAKEASRYCGGESDIYVLQMPPNPRWRAFGQSDASVDFSNEFNGSRISGCLTTFIESSSVSLEMSDGYCDEHNPKPLHIDIMAKVLEGQEKITRMMEEIAIVSRLPHEGIARTIIYNNNQVGVASPSVEEEGKTLI